ncbi:MAG: hypothetical protein JNK22_16820, partial [Rhodocyclaceae bacterium]|nr:hypothetical protein [Rhodocyclaceae bacterium]
MSEKQAQAFAEQWRVVEQYNGEPIPVLDEFNHPTGEYTQSDALSATVFQEVETGRRYLAVRSTQSLSDVWTDIVDISILGMSEHQGQYASLKSKVQSWLANGTLTSGFTVTGHSLGGFLAGALLADFRGQIEHVFLYNAPGVGGVAATLTQAVQTLLGRPVDVIDLVKVSNLRADAGISPIAGLGVAWGTPIPIAIENQLAIRDAPAALNHSQQVLVDALAVHALLAKMDATVTLESIGAIFKASSAIASNTLESVVAAVGTLLDKSYAPVATTREDLYTHLAELHTAIAGKTFTVVSLANMTAGEIRAIASDPDMIATRYALQALNPFALLGADYGRFNAAGELDLYDPATGAGALSTDWLADRAGLLAAVLARNVADRTDNRIGGDIAYKDLARGLALGPNSLPQVGVIFGRDAGESIAFTHTRGDRVHFYGMEGNDSLLGGTSADVLEGGLGDDQLRGGKGGDSLIGGAGRDRLRGGKDADLLDGGADGDRLHGGEGIDQYWIGRNSGIDVITDFADEGALSPLLALFSNRDEEGDGQGRIRYAGNLLEGLLTADPADGQTWTGFGLIFRFNGTPGKRGLLTITDPAGEAGHEIKVMAWKSGELGLTLGARPVIAKSTQTGTGAADVLTASAPKERVFGLAGDDRITVSLADAEGWGGPGRDWISNGDGDQKLYGEEGDDVLIASAGDDELYGGTDNDALQGGADDDLLDGGDGADWLAGGSGSDVLEGGAGDDYLEGSSGWAPVGGSLPAVPAGAAVLARGQQWWIARDPDGTLRLSNWRENPHFATDEGDFLDGGAGNDVIAAGDGDDVIFGGEGDDQGQGNGGADQIFGGAG